MRRYAAAVLAVSLAGVVSCSDMPTAPVSMVTVQGTITDREGAAMAGMYVSFRFIVDRSRPQPPGSYIQTDATGSFQVTVAEGVYEVRIQPSFQNGVPEVTMGQFEVKGTGTRLDYRYAGTRISGQITGLGGSPLTSAYVSAVSYQDGHYVQASSGGSSYWILVPPGTYTINVDSGIYESGLPRFEIEATISATDTLMDFALTGREIRATVTLQGTAPLGGTHVSARSTATGVSANAAAGLDGIAILYLPDGGYEFNATPSYSHIVGPESGYWSISGDLQTAIDFPGVEWDVTLRRTADQALLPFYSIAAREIGSNRYAYTSTNVLGKFQLIVRPGTGYDLLMASSGPTWSGSFTVPNVSSATDSTFDLLIDAPAP